ncbi:MAG: HD domain-containing protein [Spirochaetes bacterium]|nr:HD domain-containing protein [Spirochaetota bacterium]
MNQENNNEIEELSELQELVPEESNAIELIGKDSADEKGFLLENPCTKGWLQSFEAHSMPWILLDRKLNLLWRNRAHEALYPDFRPGDNFIAYFYKYLGEEEISKIYRSLRSKEQGFSYQGRLEYKTVERAKIIANITLSPLFLEVMGKEEPVGFACHFDDVTSDIQNILRQTFKSLLEASKLKDNDTGNHIERVNAYSSLLAEYLFRKHSFPQIDQDFINDIGFLAAMHDVGKIGTPDDILNKKGPLEPWEWDIMKEHTKNGAFLLSTYPNPMAKEIALAHHEKWDGTGYPYGLAEEMIPLSARIVAVSDVYDALRSKRSYKEPISHEGAMNILKKGIGTHFDPRIGEAALQVQKNFEDIYSRLADP